MAEDHNNPQSRTEEILIATIDGTEYDKLPQSRLEELLLELKQAIEESGGGGGTTNYNLLSNKPQINGVTLSGEMTAADLSLVLAEVGKGLSTNDYSDEEKAKVANLLAAIEGILTGSDIDSFGDVETALANKVDKVNGKGLSTNDFTNTYKDAIDANTTAITAIKDGTDINSFGDVEVALLDKADTSDLGTAAAKDSTNSVTAGSTDLVESGAVKDAIDAAVAAAYHHAGIKTVAQLTHDLLIAANEGNVYNITDSGTTTSDFIEGIGKQIDAGDNVGICKVGNVYMFDLLSGLEDTSIFVQKSQTSGLLKNDGTVNSTIEDTVAGHTTALAGKQDTLTFDDTPTDGSNNPVKSNGIYDSEKDIYAAMGEMGAKNLIPYPYNSGSYSQRGIYFTSLSDGTIKANGTNDGTGNSTYIFKSFTLSKGAYVVNGCPIQTSNNYRLVVARVSDDTTLASDTGSGVNFTLDADTDVKLIVQVFNGRTVNNIIFKPMLRLASDIDDTYQPYAKTNKQLTDDVALLDSKKADTDMVAADFNAGTSYTAGNYCIYEGKFYKFKNNHSGAWSAADVDEIKIAGELSALKSGLTNVDVALSVPEGTGKNLIPMTVDGIKALNTSGTWSGNAYTINDFTFTVQTDSDGNVSGISANGTVPSGLWGLPFCLPSTSVKDGKSYTLTGCPNGGSSSTYTLYTTDDSDNNISDYGNGITYTANFTGHAYVRIAIYGGTTVNNIVFHPMIRLASVSDPAFAPYIPSVESRIEAVESGLTNVTPDIKTVTASPDTNGFINLSTYGYSKNSHKYVNAVVVDNNYNIKMWKHSSYGWIVTLYTAETFTRVTDPTVSVDLVVFGIKA